MEHFGITLGHWVEAPLRLMLPLLMSMKARNFLANFNLGYRKKINASSKNQTRPYYKGSKLQEKNQSINAIPTWASPCLFFEHLIHFPWRIHGTYNIFYLLISPLKNQLTTCDRIIYYPYPWESVMGLIPSQVVFNDFHPRQLDVPRINVRVGPTVFSWCSLTKNLGDIFIPTFFVGFFFVGIISNYRGTVPRWDRYYWYIPTPTNLPRVESPVYKQSKRRSLWIKVRKALAFTTFTSGVMILSPLLRGWVAMFGQRLKTKPWGG